MTDTPLSQLIRRLSRLPGLGPRSAQRAALYLLRHRETQMRQLATELNQVARQYQDCQQCGNLDLQDICGICSDARRDRRRICVLEDISDLWAMERAGIFNGTYHILGGTLNALDGIGPEDLGIKKLLNRLEALPTDAVESYSGNNTEEQPEIILATSATVDGQTTAYYIAERLQDLPVLVSRLAHGMPVGGELNYLDDGTLAQAMKARTKL